MGNDYVARKSAKKRKKKERQEVGKDGVARRERRRKKIRRLCQVGITLLCSGFALARTYRHLRLTRSKSHTLQGVCYKPPELTAADKAEPWDEDDTLAGVSGHTPLDGYTCN